MIVRAAAGTRNSWNSWKFVAGLAAGIGAIAMVVLAPWALAQQDVDAAPLDNNTTSAAVSGAQGDTVAFVMDVPEGAVRLQVELAGLPTTTGDADLYVGHSDVPTESAWDCRPWVDGSTESCVIDDPAAGQWFAVVRGYLDFTDVTVSVSWTEAPSMSQLELGTTSAALSGMRGDSHPFVVQVPNEPGRLTVELSELPNGSGDADLYVNPLQMPTLTDWECRPWIGGNKEICTIESPLAGPWYINVLGYGDFANVTVTATWTPAVMPATLQAGLPSAPVSGSMGDEIAFMIDVPEGVASLQVIMQSLVDDLGDADLYVAYGQLPTLDSWSCRPWVNGSFETCNIAAPAAGPWFIMVQGYADFSQVLVVADWEVGAVEVSCEPGLRSVTAAVAIAMQEQCAISGLAADGCSFAQSVVVDPAVAELPADALVEVEVNGLICPVFVNQMLPSPEECPAGVQTLTPAQVVDLHTRCSRDTGMIGDCTGTISLMMEPDSGLGYLSSDIIVSVEVLRTLECPPDD